MSQLLLDVYATTRIRPASRWRRGRWPIERHQRGYVTLPREIAAHPQPGMPRPKIGDVLPAWVCCRCGGVELGRYALESQHGCCNPDRINPPCDRRASWPGWTRDFDNHWTPHHPGRPS